MLYYTMNFAFSSGKYRGRTVSEVIGYDIEYVRRLVIEDGARASPALLKALEEVHTLYLLRVFSVDEEFFKIGLTSKKISERFSNRQKHSLTKHYRYEVVDTLKIESRKRLEDLEQNLHSDLRTKFISYKPKNYFAGHTECYKVSAKSLILEEYNKVKSKLLCENSPKVKAPTIREDNHSRRMAKSMARLTAGYWDMSPEDQRKYEAAERRNKSMPITIPKVLTEKDKLRQAEIQRKKVLDRDKAAKERRKKDRNKGH